MLNYIYQTLRFFRNAFSRNITWLMFFMVVLGFIGASEMIAVTSFCRFWCLNTTVIMLFSIFFDHQHGLLIRLLNTGIDFCPFSE